METCNFCPTLHRSVGQSGGPASGVGAFIQVPAPLPLPVRPPPSVGWGRNFRGNEECFLNQTANYQLCQWDPTDRILMEDFNSDNSKIDVALAGLAGQISAVSAGMGNCEMEVLTYTGAGGAEPRKITFSQVPDVFLVAGNLAFIMGQGGKATAILTCKDATYSESFVNDVDVAWSGSQLTLTNTVNARYQMDTKNKPYWVLGLKKKG